MDVVWNRQRVLELLRSFYLLVQTRVGLFDTQHRELLAYPEESCAYCDGVKAGREGAVPCERCDAAAYQRAMREKGSYSYRCHAGLREMIAPIRTPAGGLLGYLMIGQMRPAGEDTPPPAYRHLQEAYARLRPIEEDQLRACAEILQACAAYVWLEEYVGVRNGALPDLAARYIRGHLAQPLTLGEIAAACGVGKTTLCNMAAESWGCSVGERIRELRLREAKRLLREGRLSVAAVAAQVGIPDYNYFARVFKAAEGMPPSVYRKRQRQR